MGKYNSSSENETKKIAAEFARNSKDRIFALTGELGAGKTIFVQGFAKGLRIRDKIISPTFVLIRQHKISNTEKVLYHIDLYRLEDSANFKEMGLDEILSDQKSVVLIEWAEKLKELPKNSVKINITKGSNQKRIITIF